MHEEDLGNHETSRSAEMGDDKLVPVSESIRYRKRAQAAEMKLEELEKAYQKQAGELGVLQEQMASIRVEGQLRERLGAAKAVDVETALLVVRNRLGGTANSDDDLSSRIECVIDEVRQEKPFLFGAVSGSERKDGRIESFSKTQSVKRDRSSSMNRVLQQAAEAAVQSGSRGDVQEYLRIKRQTV